MPAGTNPATNNVTGAGEVKGQDNTRTKLEVLRSELETKRSSYISHWRTLGNFITPRRPRFTTTDANKGGSRTNNIIDDTATDAASTLAAGMMSGITSPARPWFKLTTPDPQLANSANVKAWLEEVAERMQTVFLRSNLYNVLPIAYSDIGTFGTSAIFVEEDFDDVVRFYPMPIGSYYLATDRKGNVDTFFREYRMTVRQIVDEFGRHNGPRDEDIDWTNISSNVKNQYERGIREQEYDIYHVIKPNSEYDPTRGGSEFKKFISIYYEAGKGENSNLPASDLANKFLRQRGYDFFPVLAPRWEKTGEDVYGSNCPGMRSLGNVKQIQVMERRGAQAIHKMIDPPMTGPSSLKSSKTSILPGDITYSDERDGQKGFRPAHEIRFPLDMLEAKEEQIRRRIERAWYVDLFLMLARMDNSREITATEIAERKEEKILALGPVLEQLNQDLLDPLINIVFAFMVRQDLIPAPPPELEDVQLKVEYISVMAQALKQAGLANMDRFAAFVQNAATVMPDALDKINIDKMIDEYAKALGVPEGVLRTDEEVGQIRDLRAQFAQKQAEAQQARENAAAARDMAAADMSGDNALTRVADEAAAA